MEKTRIVFLGINEAGRRIHDWLVRHEEVIRLITRKEELDTIEQAKPDMLISCGFRFKVPSDLLQLPPKGCINIHSSYLPFNRGANPNVWSIVEGSPAGVTIHLMDDNYDTGAIIARQKIKIDYSDNAKDVYERLEDAQYDLFIKMWGKIKAGSYSVIEQEKEEGTLHTIQDFKELCRIDLDKKYTGRELLNRLRALTFFPYDNAYVVVNGKKYYLRLEVYTVKQTE